MNNPGSFPGAISIPVRKIKSINRGWRRSCQKEAEHLMLWSWMTKRSPGKKERRWRLMGNDSKAREGGQESGLVLLQSKESVKDRREFRGQILQGTAFQAKEVVVYPASHWGIFKQNRSFLKKASLAAAWRQERRGESKTGNCLGSRVAVAVTQGASNEKVDISRQKRKMAIQTFRR